MYHIRFFPANYQYSKDTIFYHTYYRVATTFNTNIYQMFNIIALKKKKLHTYRYILEK